MYLDVWSLQAQRCSSQLCSKILGCLDPPNINIHNKVWWRDAKSWLKMDLQIVPCNQNYITPVFLVGVVETFLAGSLSLKVFCMVDRRYSYYRLPIVISFNFIKVTSLNFIYNLLKLIKWLKFYKMNKC